MKFDTAQYSAGIALFMLIPFLLTLLLIRLTLQPANAAPDIDITPGEMSTITNSDVNAPTAPSDDFVSPIHCTPKPTPAMYPRPRKAARSYAIM